MVAAGREAEGEERGMATGLLNEGAQHVFGSVQHSFADRLVTT